MSVTPSSIQALVFDAYGTLLDPESIGQQLSAFLPSEAEAVMKVWRQKQLEYTWLRTLMQRYKDFYALTEEALHFALQACECSLNEESIRRIMSSYCELQAYPDALPSLSELSDQYQLAILSNANPSLLERAARHTGLEAHLHRILSADQARMYKPRPEVYALATEALKATADAMLFISSNTWDIAGAASAGLQTVWIDRQGGQLEQLGFQPEARLRTLSELPGLLRTGS